MRAVAGLLLSFLLFACGRDLGSSLSEPRPLNKDERLADFDQVTGQVQALYGPLQYKERRFPGFVFAAHAAALREKVEGVANDSEFYSLVNQLVGKFGDGHIQIEYPSDRIVVKKIPVLVESLEGKAIVVAVEDSLKDEKIAAGDEVVKVDGIEAMEYLPLFTSHESFGNPESDKQLIFRLFKRPSNLQGARTLADGRVAAAQPTAPFAQVEFRRADGTSYVRQLLWRVTKDQALRREFIPHQIGGELFASGASALIAEKRADLAKFGNDQPLIVTPAVSEKFNLGRVYVDKSDSTLLAKFETKPEDIDDKIYGAWFRHKNKNVFFIRQPGYQVANPEARLKTYRLLLAQNQGRMDVLIVDQMHNPGGSSDYLESFTGLFAKDQFRSYVQYMNADRKWLRDVRANFEKLPALEQDSEAGLRYLQIAADIEQAYNTVGQRLTHRPYSFTGTNYISADKHFTWDKPVLVLADEMAGSCGDLFPMMMQRNQRAKVFGNRTMGLGGSVEGLDPLTNSRIVAHLTRGLLTGFREDGVYGEGDFIENNGVTPDILRPRTVDDARSGYLAYFAAVADAAVAQVVEPAK